MILTETKFASSACMAYEHLHYSITSIIYISTINLGFPKDLVSIGPHQIEFG